MALEASVIIPYRNRRNHLEKVLRALLYQTWSHETYEIIVVDDGKVPSIDDLIKGPISLIRSSGQGAAYARNLGLTKANGKIIIFLDCDIVVTNSFIKTHCDFHRQNPNYILIGQRLYMNPGNNEVQSIDTRTKLLKRFKKKVSDLHHPWFMTYTCNVSLKKHLTHLEKFDEAYVKWGLEDVEWAYRLYKRGCMFSYSDDVTGVHLYHDRSMTDKKYQGWKENLSYTIKKHPELTVLENFLDVFNPNVKSDYFEVYDLFEGCICTEH